MFNPCLFLQSKRLSNIAAQISLANHELRLDLLVLLIDETALELL